MSSPTVLKSRGTSMPCEANMSATPLIQVDELVRSMFDAAL
jgi:hypothetical protein